MDIGILTTDALFGRFLCLELQEAGYNASVIVDFSVPAVLYLCDLDTVAAPYPENTIGFSYEERRAAHVRAFLPRPVDAVELRAVVKAQYPRGGRVQKPVLWVNSETRIARGERGSVRLSQKELALLLILAEGKVLTREDGGGLFGGDGNAVNVYVHYLRRKLESVCGAQTVAAVRGVGYTLSDAITIEVQ